MSERLTFDLREPGALAIGTPVSVAERGRRVAGVVALYRSLPAGRLYTIRADSDGRLIAGLLTSRLTPL